MTSFNHLQVTTIARRLISEKNLLESMYRFLANFLRRYADAKTLTFQARRYPTVLRRALSVVDDSK